MLSLLSCLKGKAFEPRPQESVPPRLSREASNQSTLIGGGSDKEETKDSSKLESDSSSYTPPNQEVVNAGLQKSHSVSSHLRVGLSPESRPDCEAKKQPVYPWSHHQLALSPPLTIPKRGGVVPPAPASPSPFPRYSHAMPNTTNDKGELFIFGGLSDETVHNDLYVLSTQNMSVALWQTTGDIPSPRVGHASALVGSVLIIWGGDTKSSNTETPEDPLDDGLHLLNLVSREWTLVRVYGHSPVGRYGHAAIMVGSKFYMFGGQVDGASLNDVWAFDLHSLRSKAMWEQVELAEGSARPAPRSGHTIVSYEDKIIMFGGNDGQYLYNDTWMFDTAQNEWTELSCIGFIPASREGHAACVVDDVVYIFGGRGMDGKDLGDIAALNFTARRWFMFQKMGPAPSPRTGHAMATVGSLVFVVGGRSAESCKDAVNQDNTPAVQVLDTKHITYPVGNKAPQPRAPGPG